MQYNFSATTGMTTMIRGWMYNFDDFFGYYTWNYFSAYLETSVFLDPGLNIIDLESLFNTDLEITAEIIVSGSGAEFIYALNSFNPVDEDIPMGDTLGYLDLKITNHSLLTENITLIITFPTSVDLSIYYTYFWGWNMDGTNQWNGAPQEFYDACIYDYTDNSLTIIFPVGGSSGPLSITMAVSYILASPELIPGFPLLMTLGFLMVSTIALIMIHFKKVKKL